MNVKAVPPGISLPGIWISRIPQAVLAPNAVCTMSRTISERLAWSYGFVSGYRCNRRPGHVPCCALTFSGCETFWTSPHLPDCDRFAVCCGLCWPPRVDYPISNGLSRMQCLPDRSPFSAESSGATSTEVVFAC